MVTPQQEADAMLRRWQENKHLVPPARIEAVDAEPAPPPLTEEQFQIAQSDVAWEMSKC